MVLSKILQEIGDNQSKCIQETEFTSLAMLIEGYGEKDCCVFIADEKYLGKLKDDVKMVITTPKIFEKMMGFRQGICITDNPRIKFYEIHNYLSHKEYYKRKVVDTQMADNCTIARNSEIASKNVIIEEGVTVHPFAVIRENTHIKKNAVIRSGAVIGNPGFDYKSINGSLIMTEQVGGIIIEENVEIGSNTCIECACFPYEDTVIGRCSKIGALCYISHGTRIGERVLMPNCISISGYTIIDNDVHIGPGATITNICHIKEGANITIGSVVCSNVRKHEHVTGNFAIQHEKFLNNYRNSLRGQA